MGIDLSKEARKNALVDKYPTCDFLYEIIYNKIKENESNIQLYILLGKVKYISDKFQEESLHFHIKYLETGDEFSYIQFMNLVDKFNNMIDDITKDVSLNTYKE